MEGVGHSSLLKFFVDIPKITMSEHETSSSSIESQVPRLQQLRSITETTFDEPEWENTRDKNADDAKTDHNRRKGDVDKLSVTAEEEVIVTYKVRDKTEGTPTEQPKENDTFGFTDKKGHDVTNVKAEENAVSSKDDFMYSPVITVTKEESTLTKGDVKLQKVVVSEDISDELTTKHRSLRVTEACNPDEVNTKIRSEVLAVPIRTDHSYGNNDLKKTEGGDHNDTKKIQTKIPKLRLKQVVERIKKEKQEGRNNIDPESSPKVSLSIPRLKDMKNPPQHNFDSMQSIKSQEVDSPKVDDEFDKIYEEIIENEASNNIPSPEKISNPIKLESKFEEIIHAYDENNVQPISIEKTKSKIPLLKRKSEQEIEIPPPSNRKHSLKRSNTEDFKGKIPVAIAKEKPMKLNVENIKNEATSTNIETTASMKSEGISKRNKELLDTVNTSLVKKVNNPTSMDMNELSKTSTTGNVVVKTDKTNNNNVKDTARCKIPVAFNSKESIDTKINSTSLNKHPTRVNVIEKISSQATSDKTDKIIDKNVEQPQSYNIVTHNVKSSTVFLHSENQMKEDDSQISETTNVSNKLVTEQTTFLIQKSQASNIENSGNFKLHTQNESKNIIFDVPIEPRLLIKTEKVTNIPKKEAVSPENITYRKTNQCDITSLDDNKSANKDSSLSENKHNFNVSDFKSNFATVEVLEKTVDSSTNAMQKYHNKNSDDSEQGLPIQNENEKKSSTSEMSNVNNIIENSKPIIFNSNSTIMTKQDFKEIKEQQKIPDLIDKSLTTGSKSSYNGVQHFKNQNIIENNKPHNIDVSKLKTDSEKPDKINHKSKEKKIDSDKNQTINKLELTLNSPIKPTGDENNTNAEFKPNAPTIATKLENIHKQGSVSSQKQIEQKIIQTLNTGSVKDLCVSNPKTIDNTQTAVGESIEKNIVVNNKISKSVQKVSERQEKNSKEEDPSAISTNIEEKEEEDIIMLKGKVNRVIRRLDSKDHKAVKKEIDDVPKGVSVISKIAIFDKSGSTDTLSKTNELNVNNTEVINQNIIANDKPIIVNEILKTDIYQNEINDKVQTSPSTGVHVESTVYNVNSKNANDFEVKKVNTTESKRVFKTKNLPKNSLNEGNKIRRTISSVVGENNEVFVKKDDDAACLEIWKEYRRKKELDSDMRRAKSLAELDLGDAVRGRVRQLVVRMSSVEHGCAERRAHVDGKEKPTAGSVSRRIALYERKLAPCRAGDAPPSSQPAKPHAAAGRRIGEQELRSRIEELRTAKVKYGQLDHVPHVELNDGGRMPVLALGTAMLEPALIGPVISAAIELGFRAVDAAYVYGNEREVGQAIREKIQDGTVARSELFIINKLWSTFHRRDLVEKACRQSLDAMGLDYFDLYLIHNPMSFKEGPNPFPKIANVLQYSENDYLEAWFGIEGLVKKGLVRRGGLSNFNSVQIERVIEKGWIKPVVNQVECHPYLTQLRLEEFCLSRNIKLSCFGVLGSKGTPPEFTSGLPPVIDDPLVKVMAAGLGVTPAQLLISYQLRLGRGVVVKCSSAPHLAQARAPATLNATHVAALNALNRNKRMFTFQGMGDTHRNYPFKIPF